MNGQEIQSENTQTPSDISQEESVSLQKSKLKKILNTSSWVALIFLAPVALLIFLSQDTIPGDLFYPIKRGMEGVVLAAASVNPATRVAFRTDLTQKRFNEAEKLLLASAGFSEGLVQSGQATKALDSLVNEVATAQEEVSSLSNSQNRTELTEKLIDKIDEYQNKLAKVQAQTPSPTNTPVPTSPPQQPQATTVPSPTTTPVATQPPSQPLTSPTEPTITAQSTIQPTPTLVEVQPSPTAVPIAPPGTVGTAIDDTQKKLEEIKRRLKEKQEKHEDELRKRHKEERSNIGESTDENHDNAKNDKDEALKKRQREKD